VVEASYIGNHALHIQRRLDWNDVVPNARLAVAQAVRANDPIANELINSNRRLPGVGSIFMIEPTGDSSYHALQVWANRRFSNRLAFQAAYTWSHSITNVPLSFDSGTTDPFNYDLDRGDANLDRRHMFVANAVVVLPSLKNLNVVAKNVLGDWQLNVIASLLDGTPLDLRSGTNTAGLAASFANLGQRPDLVPGVPVYLHKSGDRLRYLNPAAFALPDVGKFGNLGRGSIRGPGIKNFDFSVVKNWKMRDQYRIQFRAEMFNAFNHPNFTAVNADLSFNNIAGDENFGKPLNPAFGVLNSTRGAREIQFGLKLSF
jgi:hypothetical protein